MSTTWRRMRRRLAVLAIVPFALTVVVVAAPSASAGAATYVDPAGDVVADGTGAHVGSGAGDILTYTVDLDDASGELTVAVVTAATAADPLPALFGPGPNSALIAIFTSGNSQPDFFAETSAANGWVVYDERTGAEVCQPGQVGYYGPPDEFSFWVPLTCIGSPSHVGIQVQLRVKNASDSAPDYNLPGTPGASSGPDVAPADVPRVAVYRFWSLAYGNAHFFTASSAEAENVDFAGFAWRFEGFAFSALPVDGAACDNGMPMYRFWSRVFSSHFYTLNAGEKDHIVAADHNWQYEGVAFCAYATEQTGTVPLYRFWSPNFGKHFFTADQAEADHITAVDHNWQYEGIAAYVYPEA